MCPKLPEALAPEAEEVVTPLEKRLQQVTEDKGEEAAKAYARSLGGFPKGFTLAGVNGHTKGWDECASLLAPLLVKMHEALEFYAGNRPKEAVWKHAMLMGTDKFGCLDDDLSGPKVALDAVASFEKFLEGGGDEQIK